MVLEKCCSLFEECVLLLGFVMCLHLKRATRCPRRSCSTCRKSVEMKWMVVMLVMVMLVMVVLVMEE